VKRLDELMASLPKRRNQEEPPLHRSWFAGRGVASTTHKNESYRAMHLPWVESEMLDVSPYRKRGSALALWDVQREALWHIQAAQGAVVAIGVGHGKTYIGLLAGAVLDADVVIVLCPPATLGQMTEALAQIDNEFVIPPTHLLSYGRYSRRDGEREFMALVGDDPARRVLVVADEAHCLKNRTAARTKRFLRFFRSRPSAKLVAMSGTMTTRSLADFAHLAEIALGERSPLPRSQRQLKIWCRVFDAQRARGRHEAHRPVAGVVWMAFAPLWSKIHGSHNPLDVRDVQKRRTMMREALASRLKHSAGMVITEQSSVGASLVLDRLPVTIPASISATLASLETVTTPNQRAVVVGAGISTARPLPDAAVPLERWRLAHQLSKGFYYRWAWPGGKVDTQWLEARTAWGRVVGQELDRHAAAGYDSPLLVASRVSREAALGASQPKHVAWRAWAAVRERPAPPTECVWLDLFLIEAVERWAASRKERVLVWYADVAVADKLSERGLTVLRGGDEVIHAVNDESIRVLCLSAHAHATGLNLQAFGAQALLGLAGGARGIEQLLGRTHRAGQARDEVWAWLPLHTDALRDSWRKLTDDARYIEQATGARQKVCYAVYTAAAGCARPTPAYSPRTTGDSRV